MPCIAYKEMVLRGTTHLTIRRANEIIAEYAKLGYHDFTLRQLYYVFVSRDFIPNTKQSYQRFGDAINNGRLCGLIDWDVIVDRTRNLHRLSTWDSPEEIVKVCSETFRYDKWLDQKYRPEIWIEKEALSGVFQRICDELQVSLFACRGYTSQSEAWSAAMRLKAYSEMKQIPYIFHFGDHDPSGIDMSRDIQDRLRMFGAEFEFTRVALNMDQVEKHKPPPNFAKESDARFQKYKDEYGDQSWELDALDPVTLTSLVREKIKGLRQQAKWNKQRFNEDQARNQLKAIANHWKDVATFAYKQSKDEEQ